MPFDFPNSPAVGDQVSSPGGNIYMYDGVKWSAPPPASLPLAYLPLSGGTLTGPLTLAADPAVALGAATKSYVDTGGTAVARLKTRIYDPLDYGAVYDNVADDGPAIQRAISAAQVTGGIVGIRAPGNPIRIGTGLILANGVKLVGMAGRNFTNFNATPGGANGWGRYGVYFRPTDMVNACIRMQGHGSEIHDINFVYDQPIPDTTFTPIVYPYAIDCYANYVTVTGVDIIGASHGFRIRYGGGVANGGGGGTRVVFRDVTIDSYYVGFQTQNINDCIVLENISCRGIYYVTNALVTAFREANQIAWDCYCTENPWISGMQFFQAKVGILLTNGTVMNNTHSLFGATIVNIQFNLVRIAIATTAADTIATGTFTNVMAQTDTETQTTDTMFQFYSNGVNFAFNGAYMLGGGEIMRIKSGSTVQMTALRVYDWSASMVGAQAFAVETGGTLILGTRHIVKRRASNGSFIAGGGNVASANYACWVPFSDFTQRTIALTGALQNAANIDWPYTPIGSGAKQYRFSGTVNVSVAVAAGTFALSWSGFPEIAVAGLDCATTGGKSFNTNWVDFGIAAPNNQVGRPTVQGTSGATVQFGSVTLEFR